MSDGNEEYPPDERPVHSSRRRSPKPLEPRIDITSTLDTPLAQPVTRRPRNNPRSTSLIPKERNEPGYRNVLIATGVLFLISILSLGTVLILLHAGGSSEASIKGRIDTLNIALGGSFAAFISIFYILFKSFKALVTLLCAQILMIFSFTSNNPFMHIQFLPTLPTKEEAQAQNQDLLAQIAAARTTNKETLAQLEIERTNSAKTLTKLQAALHQSEHEVAQLNEERVRKEEFVQNNRLAQNNRNVSPPSRLATGPPIVLLPPPVGIVGASSPAEKSMTPEQGRKVQAALCVPPDPGTVTFGPQTRAAIDMFRTTGEHRGPPGGLRQTGVIFLTDKKLAPCDTMQFANVYEYLEYRTDNRGTSADKIKDLQAELRAKGKNVPDSGQFDRPTRTAIGELQEANGMKRTGQVTRDFLGLLRNVSPVVPPPRT
jgi:hypothetical protein